WRPWPPMPSGPFCPAQAEDGQRLCRSLRESPRRSRRVQDPQASIGRGAGPPRRRIGEIAAPFHCNSGSYSPPPPPGGPEGQPPGGRGGPPPGGVPVGDPVPVGEPVPVFVPPLVVVPGLFLSP